MALAQAVSEDWLIPELDVQMAFLNASIQEEAYLNTTRGCA